MPKLIIHKLAQKVLEELALRDSQNYERIRRGLNELMEKGLQASNCKKIAAGQKIFRKRVGRYRLLFTIDGDSFHIWIIGLKKSSRDYVKWIMYIELQKN